MSRAFVSENDGWNHCVLWNHSCILAERDGSCMVNECTKHAPRPAAQTAEKEKK